MCRLEMACAAAARRAIIMSATVKKRSMHGDFLKKIPLMSTLEKLECETIIDCMEEEKFTAGGVIIEQVGSTAPSSRASQWHSATFSASQWWPGVPAVGLLPPPPPPPPPPQPCYTIPYHTIP